MEGKCVFLFSVSNVSIWFTLAVAFLLKYRIAVAFEITLSDAFPFLNFEYSVAIIIKLIQILFHFEPIDIWSAAYAPATTPPDFGKRKREKSCPAPSLLLGVVKRIMKDLTGRVTYACLVPAAMRVELFKRVHGQDAGHFGYAKIYPLFSERFFWHGMSTDIKNCLTCCELCQRIKPGPGKACYALVQEIAGAPKERCCVDLSGPWPLSKQGNQYLCMVQDYFSKWIRHTR